MRFGFCGNLVASGPDKTGIEIVEKVAEYGYDYIELPIAEMTALPQAEFRALKARVAATGLRCESCNNFFPGSIRLTGPDVDDLQVEEYYLRALDRAQELGVETVVFGSYMAKRVPDGFYYERAYDQLLTLHRRVNDAARARGIMIAIEPTRTPLTNVFTTFEKGVRFAELADCSNIKVLIDNYHMDAENESPDILRKFGEKWLAHVHFSNPNLAHPDIDRVVPESMEEWNYRPFINALHAIRYQGRISVEAGTDNFDRSAKNAIRLMRENFNW